MEEYLRPWGMSINWLAKALHMEASSVRQIVRGERRITPRTALLLSRYFGTDPQRWLDRNSEDALRIAERSPDIIREVSRVEPLVLERPIGTSGPRAAELSTFRHGAATRRD